MCNDEYIRNFYNEITNYLGGNYKIILEPPSEALSESWIEYDTVKWEMEDSVNKLVSELLKDNSSTLEEKIMKVYEFICLNYVYDANVLYLFKRDASDPNNIKYIAVDWYGRIVGQDWIEKRKLHNRRICYEFSRFYAKAINTLIDGKEELEAVMIGDVENTHYVVGLTGKNYSIILDQDDFNSIKDLTRLKLGLTIKGIHILRDETGNFTNVVNKFNSNKPTELSEIEQAKADISKTGIIQFFSTAITTINKYNIDPQGFFECIRALIEEQGFKIEKIWKKDVHNDERRHERCLYFEYEGKTYLLDSIDKTLTMVNIEDLDKNVFILNAQDNLYDYYGG